MTYLQGKWQLYQSQTVPPQDNKKARKQRDAADVLFGLKLADNIHKFRSSH